MLPEARRQYDIAISLAPQEPPLHEEQASMLAELGLFAEAADRYRTALRLRPDSPQAMRRLAWILATCPDDRVRGGREALEISQRVCGLPGQRTADSLAVLAAAYAEVGDFARATQAAQEALAAAASQPRQVQDLFRRHLEDYRAGRPVRQAAP